MEELNWICHNATNPGFEKSAKFADGVQRTVEVKEGWHRWKDKNKNSGYPYEPMKV